MHQYEFHGYTPAEVIFVWFRKARFASECQTARRIRMEYKPIPQNAVAAKAEVTTSVTAWSISVAQSPALAENRICDTWTWTYRKRPNTLERR
jgi:hypothetical protein